MTTFGKKLQDHRSFVVGSTIRIYGVSATISGLGKKAIRFKSQVPKGFSTKKEFTEFFVDYSNITNELFEQLNELIPSPSQKTLDSF